MIWFEDLPAGRKDSFGRMPVKREDMLDFARKYDPQPFHVDDNAAAANPLFGQLAASGWHTAALGVRMTIDFWGSLGDRAILGGAGIDELRWLRPVYPGDILRTESEVVEARLSASRPGTGIVRTRIILFNQDDLPVLSQITNILMLCRPADD